eukprot:336402-Lingulodinium_polyedra.AAC.1
MVSLTPAWPHTPSRSGPVWPSSRGLHDVGRGRALDPARARSSPEGLVGFAAAFLAPRAAAGRLAA